MKSKMYRFLNVVKIGDYMIEEDYPDFYITAVSTLACSMNESEIIAHRILEMADEISAMIEKRKH